MTREDYEELKRLRDERGCTVAFRNPRTHEVAAMGFMESGSASCGTLEFIKDGQAIHISTVIADYEREHKED